MVEKGDLGNPEIDTLDALFAELAGGATDDQDAEYPLPEKKPVKFTNVDVVVMPRGYKSEYPKPEDSKPRYADSVPSMKLDVENAEEADGVLSVPVVVANAKHIYDYDGLKVLKPFDELEAAALFADGIPITREHPPAGIVTDRGQVLGFLKSPTAKDDLLKGILAITDKDLIADVKDKKLTEVSAGFFCDLDASKGELEGVKYDAVQKNIFLNHVAVVENGRCSIDDGCGIGLDAKKFPVPSELMDKIKAAIARAKAMKDKSLYNMLKELLKMVSVKKDTGEPETLPLKADAMNLVKIKDAFAKLTAERDLLKDGLAKIEKAEKDVIIAELVEDSGTKEELEKLALDELQKRLDMAKAIKAKHLSAPDSRGSGGESKKDEIYGRIGKGGK